MDGNKYLDNRLLIQYWWYLVVLFTCEQPRALHLKDVLMHLFMQSKTFWRNMKCSFSDETSHNTQE